MVQEVLDQSEIDSEYAVQGIGSMLAVTFRIAAVAHTGRVIFIRSRAGWNFAGRFTDVSRGAVQSSRGFKAHQFSGLIRPSETGAIVSAAMM